MAVPERSERREPTECGKSDQSEHWGLRGRRRRRRCTVDGDQFATGAASCRRGDCLCEGPRGAKKAEEKRFREEGEKREKRGRGKEEEEEEFGRVVRELGWDSEGEVIRVRDTGDRGGGRKGRDLEVARVWLGVGMSGNVRGLRRAEEDDG